jgi:hypothetical protein
MLIRFYIDSFRLSLIKRILQRDRASKISQRLRMMKVALLRISIVELRFARLTRLLPMSNSSRPTIAGICHRLVQDSLAYMLAARIFTVWELSFYPIGCRAPFPRQGRGLYQRLCQKFWYYQPNDPPRSAPVYTACGKRTDVAKR